MKLLKWLLYSVLGLVLLVGAGAAAPESDQNAHWSRFEHRRRFKPVRVPVVRGKNQWNIPG